jgi:hypothetical protein
MQGGVHSHNCNQSKDRSPACRSPCGTRAHRRGPRAGLQEDGQTVSIDTFVPIRQAKRVKLTLALCVTLNDSLSVEERLDLSGM